MDLRHRSSTPKPFLGQLPLEEKEVFESLIKIMQDTFQNIFDDLTNLMPATGSDLPTATVDYYKRFFVKNNGTADDTVHICIYDGSAGAYKWQQVTIS